MKIHDGKDNVVHLDLEKAPSVRREKQDPFGCRHRGALLVSERRRVVVCQLCEEDLDPIDALIIISQHWERYAQSIERFKLESQRRYDAVEEAKREERNAKARAKRAKARGEDPS